MTDKSVFDFHVQQAQANLAEASIGANASLANLSYMDMGKLRTDAMAGSERVLDEQSAATVKGTLANIIESAKVGFSGGVGHLKSTGEGLKVTDLATLPQEVIDAYNVTMSAYSTEDELTAANALLDSQVATKSDAPAWSQHAAVQSFDSESYTTKIKRAIDAQKQAKDIISAADISGGLNKVNRESIEKNLSEDFANLSEAWDEGGVEGLVGTSKALAGTIGTVFGTDIKGTLEVAAESIGSLPLMGTDTPGYSLEIFNKALTDYQDKNLGKLPSQSEMKEMLAWSTGAGLADRIGDKLLVGSVVKAGKAGNKGELASAIKNIIGTGASEAVTEGVQAAIEEDLSKLKDFSEINVENVFKSAALGMGAGGVTAGAGSALSGVFDTGKTVSNKIADKVSSTTKAKADKVEVSEAVKAVLAGDAESIITTMKARREAGKDTTTVLDELNQVSQNADVPIAVKQEVASEVVKDINTAKLVQSDLEGKIEDATLEGDFELVDKLTKELRSQSQKVEDLNTASKPITDAATLDTDEIMAYMESVSSGKDLDAARQVFGSFKLKPDSVTTEQLQTLKDTDTLSKEENQVLDAEISVRQLMNSFSGTSKEVLEGGYNKMFKRNMLGLTDYKNMIMSGDLGGGLKGLGNFAKLQAAKYQELSTAFESAKVTGKAIKVGDYTIHSKSGKLITQVKLESDLLTSAFTELNKIPTFGEPTNEAITEDIGVEDTETNTGTQTGESIDTTSTNEGTVQKQEETSQKSKTSGKLKSSIVTSGTNVVKVVRVGSNTYKVLKDGSVINKVGKTVTNKKTLGIIKATQVVTESRERVPTEPIQATNVEDMQVQEDYDLPDYSDEVEDYVDTSDTGLDIPVSEPIQRTREAVELPTDYSLAKELTSQEVGDLPFESQNHVAKFFTTTKKSLAIDTIPNLGEVLKKDLEAVLPDATEDTQLVNDIFVRFHTAMVNKIDEYFEVTKPSTGKQSAGKVFRQNDYVQSMVDAAGNLPSNVKTAMVAGAWDWIIANGKDSTVTTSDSIRSLLGLGETDSLPQAAQESLSFGSATTSSVINNMGKAAYQALGLKTNPDALETSQSIMENSLGIRSYDAMVALGMLEESNPILLSDIAAMYHDAPTSLQDVGKRTLNLVKAAKFETITNVNPKDSQYSTKIFGSTIEKPLSYSEVPPVIQTKAKTNQKVAKEVKRVLKKVQEQPVKMNTSTVSSLRALGEDNLKKMLGWVSLDNVLDINLGSVKGKNRQVEKDIETIFNQSELVGPDKFFYQWTQWSNDRWGITNGYNPQSSKNVRYTQHYEGVETELDTTDKGQMDWFMLAVAQGFDIIPDKGFDSVALVDITNKLAEPKVRAAIDAYKRILNETHTEEDLEIVANLVKSEEGMATFNAIDAYANFELDTVTGTKFTQHLSREIDGITNGVWITSTQLAGNNIEEEFIKQRRMGVSDTSRNFAEANAEGMADSYKTLAKNWEQANTAMLRINPTSIPVYTSAQQIFGSLTELKDTGEFEASNDGRKLAKGPLMQSIYSASIGTIIGSLGNDGVDRTIKTLQKAYDGYITDGDTQTALEQANEALTLFTNVSKTKPKVLKSIADLKSVQINTYEQKQFGLAIASVYQDGLDTAMKAEYSSIFDARSKINAAANLMGELAAELYNTRRQQIIDAKGTVTASEKTLTLAEKTALDTEMKPFMAYINSYSSIYSNPKGDTQANLDSALGLTGTDEAPVNDATGKVEVKRKKKLNGSLRRTTHAMTRVMGKVGAKTVPVSTQSQDAAIQFKAMDTFDSGFNVHDATYLGYSDWVNQGMYNKGAVDVVNNYSPVVEVTRTFQRILKEAAKNPELLNKVLDSESGQKHLKNLVGLENEFEKDGKIIQFKKLPENMSNTQMVQKAFKEMVIISEEHKKNKQAIFDKAVLVEQYRNGDNSAYTMPDKVVEVQGATIINRFGSSYDTEIGKYDFDTETLVSKKNFSEVFDFMKENSTSDTPEHLNHLNSIKDNVVNKVLTPFNLHYGTSEDTDTIGITDGTDMYIVNNMAPQNSGSKVALASKMSAVEVLMHETVHNLTQTGLANNVFARGEITKIWVQAQKVINPTDFLPEGVSDGDSTYEDELKLATEKYNHIFKVREDSVINGKRVSNHLHEFVAFGMTNARFREQLKKIPFGTVKKQDGTNLFARLAYQFNKMLDSMYTWFIGSKGKTADKQLDALFVALVNLDSKNKQKMTAMIERAVKPVVEVAGQFQVMTKPILKHAGKAKIVGKPIKIIGSYILTESEKNLKESNKTAAKELVKIVTEMRGRTVSNTKIFDARRIFGRVIDQAREQHRTVLAGELTRSFKGKLTADKDTALFSVMGKTGVEVLFDQLGTEDAIKVLTDSAYRNSKIAKLTGDMIRYADHKFLTEQAENLGKFMVTGKSSIPNGLLNIQAISELAGYKTRPVYSRAAAKDVDLLSTLYAIKNSSSKNLATMAELLDTELDGVLMSLDVIREYRAKSVEDFGGNKYHMIKGYMRDMTDPNIAVKVGFKNVQAEMAAQGYVISDQLPLDESDPNTQPRFMYVNKFGGHVAFIQGTFQLKAEGTKGTDVLSVSANPLPDNVLEDDIFDAVASKKASHVYTGKIGKAGTHTVPVLNGEGQISGYRYLMNEASKDHYLNRDTSFINSISTMFGDAVVKEPMKEANKTIVDILAGEFATSFEESPSEFVRVSPFSPNAEIRQYYAMLTEETRDYAKQAFKGDIYARKDQLDLLFGYRKFSLRERIYADPKARTDIENILIPMLAKTLGGKLNVAKAVIQGEHVVQELVKFIKDIIVIRMGVLTIGNTISNITQLGLTGVPLAYTSKHYVAAYEALRKYRKMDTERQQIAVKLKNTRITARQVREYEARLIQLETELLNNPIDLLVQAGALPNIIEDTSIEVEDFSVRSAALKKVQGIGVYNKAMNKLPPLIKTVSQEVLAMKNSNMHKLLTEAAQFSDFGARYVRMKYLTEVKGMGFNQAVGQVMDEFIDYDVPTSKSLQYLNDIGLLWFTKYKLRIQKVILNMFKENPANAILFMATTGALNIDVPNVYESNIISAGIMGNINNPLGMLLDTGTDVYSVKAISSLI